MKINYKQLIQKAQNVKDNAHAPYSNFKVGACVLTNSGNMYVGVNVENSSFGATICAERNAINTAISNGEKEFLAIAIISSSNDYTYPCGICRQCLVEFSKDMEVIIAKDTKNYKTFKLSELLPHSFTQEDIK